MRENSRGKPTADYRLFRVRKKGTEIKREGENAKCPPSYKTHGEPSARLGRGEKIIQITTIIA